MAASPHSIRIVAPKAATTLSKGQKTFNTLVEKIAKQRDKLVQWTDAAQACHHAVTSEYRPAQEKFLALQAAFARSLDEVWGRPGLTKTERETLGMVIASLAENVIAQTGDDTLKPLYAKHRGSDFDAEEEDAIASMKSDMAEMFGLDVEGMEGLQSPEELLAHAMEQMEKSFAGEPSAPPRKQTAKQAAKELARAEQQKAEADQTSLSLREVYRKLASALHPDREPDLEERQRKTELMQRVNLAYDKKDLLKLLELQLELEHIDATTIAGLSEDRIKHYNKVLKEQLAELEAEIDSVQMALKMGFQMPPYETLTIASVGPRMANDIARVRHHVAQIQADEVVLQDTKALKAWIKQYRSERKALQSAMDRDFF